MTEKLNMRKRAKLLLAIPAMFCLAILLCTGSKHRAVTFANWLGRFEWPLRFSSIVLSLSAHSDSGKQANWEVGYNYMKRQCEKRPNDRYLWKWLAEIQQGMGLIEEAQDSIRHMGLLNGSLSPFERIYERGTSALAAGRYDEAIQHFREAIEHRPDLPQAHAALAAVYYRQGNQRASVRRYAEAVRLDGHFEHYVPDELRELVLTRSRFQE